MNTANKRRHETRPRHLIPWLVTASDLRRYLGRACNKCLRGRVIFFYYKLRSGPKSGTHHLLCLVPVIEPDVLSMAVADFRNGRYRRVQLSTLRKNSARPGGKL